MSDTIEITTETTTPSIDPETLIIYNLIIQMQTNYNERLASSEFDNILEDRMKTDLQCSIIREEMDKIKEQLGRDVTKYEILQANNYYHSITTFVSKEPTQTETATIDDPVIDDPVIDDQVIDDQVIDEPVIDDQVIDETIISDDPVIDDPVIDDQVIDDQVTYETIMSDDPVIDETIIQ